MKDPEFVAEMKARGQEVNPVSGADARQAGGRALRHAEGRGGGDAQGDRREVSARGISLALCSETIRETKRLTSAGVVCI